MGKKPVHRDDKRRLSRSIICVLTPRPQATPAIRKDQSAINFAKDKARELLNASVENLSVLTDQILPTVTLEMPNYYRESGEISEGLKNATALTSGARGCVLQIDVSDTESPESRQRLGISHLVAIKIGRKDAGWKALSGISSVLVETTAEKLAYLLHDIILDIAMFHSWPYLNEKYSTVEDRIEFSRMKSAFAFRKNLESYYGPIRNKDIEYFSFAAHCRNGSEFLYGQYRDLWHEFINTELGRPDPSAPTGPPPDLVNQILTRHHHGGQISQKKLSHQIAQLNNGTYLLLMTRKRPSRRILRFQLARDFGRKTYRQGLWKIVPFDKYVSNIRLLPFISLFKFTVVR